MKIIYLFSIVFLISCGGGSSSASSSSDTSPSASTISGMQGDISAIEPIDLD